MSRYVYTLDVSKTEKLKFRESKRAIFNNSGIGDFWVCGTRVGVLRTGGAIWDVDFICMGAWSTVEI